MFWYIMRQSPAPAQFTAGGEESFAGVAPSLQLGKLVLKLVEEGVETLVVRAVDVVR